MNRNTVAMFVIEEETGGNGSLLSDGSRSNSSMKTVVSRVYRAFKIFRRIGCGLVSSSATPSRWDFGFRNGAFVIEEMEKGGETLCVPKVIIRFFHSAPVQTCTNDGAVLARSSRIADE